MSHRKKLYNCGLETKGSVSKPGSKSGRTNLRMPSKLHEALVREAAQEGVSLNTWIVQILERRSEQSEHRSVAAAQRAIRALEEFVDSGQGEPSYRQGGKAVFKRGQSS